MGSSNSYKGNNLISMGVLLIVLTLVSAFLYNQTITLFPSFIHAWTQSEHYALALCFLDNGFDFFHPCTFNLQNINGITPADFPINEYIVALIMKITGTTSAVVYRVYTLGISITGLLFLYLLTKKITASEIKSFTVVAFAYLSPVYIYYQAGFLPSVPAIAFTFIAYFYFFEYTRESERKRLLLAVSFFLLAALVRRPFFIFLVAALLHRLWFMFKHRKIQWAEITTFISAIFIFIAYYGYNKYLGNTYGNAFLDSFLPARNWEELKDIFIKMYTVWKSQYLTKGHYILLIITICSSAYYFIKQKTISSENKNYWFHLVIILSGCALYFCLMTRQYFDHDYYFLDSFYIPLVLLFTFSINQIKISTKTQQIFWGAFFTAMIVFSYMKASDVQKARYTFNEWDRIETSRQNYVDSDKYLDSIGISKDAKILVIESYSTNIPFILMKRRGYTVYQTNRDNPIIPLLSYDWDYVAIQDIFLVSDVIYYYPQLTSLLERIGGNGKISLYKKRTTGKPNSLKEFLSIAPQNTVYSTSINFDSETIDVHIKCNENSTTQMYQSEPKSCLLASDSEYQTIMQINGNELKKNKNIKVLVTASVFSDKPIETTQLIATTANNVTTVYYQSFELKKQIKQSGTWQKFETQFVFPEIADKDNLKIYLWNKMGETIYYDDLNIVLYQ